MEVVILAVDNRGRRPRRPPAKTPDAREMQITSMAMDLAEEQILSGRASAQVITHFLKLGTAREKLEQERLRQENLLMEAKIKNLESQEDVKVLYADALKAMRSYSGLDEGEEE